MTELETFEETIKSMQNDVNLEINSQILFRKIEKKEIRNTINV